MRRLLSFAACLITLGAQTALSQEVIVEQSSQIRIVESSQLQALGRTPEPTCWPQAERLLRSRTALGEAVYTRLLTRPAFWHYLDCSNTETFGLEVAIHEAVHILSMERSMLLTGQRRRSVHTYFLPNQTLIELPHFETFSRREIAPAFASLHRDGYYTAYLSGRGAQGDLFSTLDELNAYTHGLIAAMALSDLHDEGLTFSDRDGVARMMHYLLVSLQHARANRPGVYSQITGNQQMVTAIRTLWNNAESALFDACSYSNLGMNDSAILPVVFTEPLLRELEPFLPNWSAELSSPIAQGCQSE